MILSLQHMEALNLVNRVSSVQIHLWPVNERRSRIHPLKNPLLILHIGNANLGSENCEPYVISHIYDLLFLPFLLVARHEDRITLLSWLRIRQGDALQKQQTNQHARSTELAVRLIPQNLVIVSSS